MSLSTGSPPPFGFLLMGRKSVTYAVIVNENICVISISHIGDSARARMANSGLWEWVDFQPLENEGPYIWW